MNLEQRLVNLNVPRGKIDAVLDTDAYNEIDDQFAIAYLLRSDDKIDTKAIYAAPFLNARSVSAADGMKKSYDEINKLLRLMDIQKDVYLGSESFLGDEKTPVVSASALDLAERVKNYSPENPLYIIAIGAITNVASAILINPDVAENAVLIWLGGHALDYHDTKEFNMRQDIAAARVIYNSGIPYVQLPCQGVVSSFTISKPELECWFLGKNKIADYLAKNAIAEADSYAFGKPWTRVIWDVTAVAWLLNENDRFMFSRIIEKAYLPEYSGRYQQVPTGFPMRYVYCLKRDTLMCDLINKIVGQ